MDVELCGVVNLARLVVYCISLLFSHSFCCCGASTRVPLESHFLTHTLTHSQSHLHSRSTLFVIPSPISTMPNTIKNEFSRRDQSSQSNPFEVMSILIDLDWALDFERGVITGSVTHTMKIVTEGTTHAKFDSSKCHISRVLINTHEAMYDTSQVSKDLGTCVSVEIPPHFRRSGTEFKVRFEYETDKDASAVQWLAPEATSSGKFPFVFTQCQAIHARSLMPCQDSPGVKTPYSATVTAPVSENDCILHVVTQSAHYRLMLSMLAPL